MRGRDEYQANATNKRGVVVDRDPAKHRIRVQFEDEDDVVSAWIDVLSKSAKTTKTFMMPDVGDEVWCGLDAKGEDGCLIGAKFNDQNAPPFGSNDDIGLTWAGGSVHVNKGSGDVTVVTNGKVSVTTSGDVEITAAKVKITASDIALESATLTHNGTDISDQHKHKDVVAGVANTGKPV